MMSGSSSNSNGASAAPASGQMDSVAELERKLAMLTSAPSSSPTFSSNASPPAFAMPASSSSTAATSSAAAAVDAKGGRNALLARIMAAQERAKQTPKPPSQEAPDLLSMDDTTTTTMSAMPPPAFDVSLLPPPSEEPPPPAFDESFMSPPPPPQSSSFLMPPPMDSPPPAFMWDPHAPSLAAPSAPDFHDLLAHEAPLPAPVQPPPYQQQQQQVDSSAEDAINAILAMEGLSDADKQALIEEQAKILASIERSRTTDKAVAAHSAADAFESRSFSANIQSIGGRNRVRMGGAALAAVEGANSFLTAEEAAQLKADMELAEALQQEEYAEAERREHEQRQERRPRDHAATPAPTPTAASAAGAAAADASNQGWLEWLGLTSSTTPTPAPASPPSFAQSPPPRGHMSTSRPPGSNNPHIGEMPSRSFEEADSLLRDRGQSSADSSQGLFTAVTDSIYTAFAQAIQPPPEGVDSSSLLAVPNVGREGSGDHATSSSSYNPYEGREYK